MALPSAVSVGSVAVVVVAGVGLAAWSANAAAQYATNRAATGASGTTTAQHARPHGAHGKSSTGAVSRPTRSTHTAKPFRLKAKPRHARPAAVPNVLVEVFNNSGITGLAASKAAVLEGAGWNVAATDNWYGQIPASTVYYPPNLRSQAKQLAKVLHIDRLRPAVAPMQFDRLTVILTG